MRTPGFQKIAFFALLALLATFAACSRTYDPTPDHVDEVFPIVDGKSRFYHVIDTSYASAQGMDARTYYKREMTDGTELDLENRETSKLWIHTSVDTLGTPEAPVYEWRYADLWTQYYGEQYAERIEGNTRYLVLKLPPYPNSTWNGNLFNNNDDQTYEYVNLDTTVTLQGKTYEHCVYILQVPFRMPVTVNPGDPPPPFFLIEHAYEIYAPGIGKIKRYCKFYEAQSNGASTTIDPLSKVFIEELIDHNYDL